MTETSESFLRTREFLKAELRVKGSSFAQISRAVGVSASSVSLVASGKHRSRRIEQAIANALGKTLGEVWPDHYEEDEM